MDGAEISAEIIAFENTLKPVLEISFDEMNGNTFPYQSISERTIRVKRSRPA
jgi:hypothetical protein